MNNKSKTEKTSFGMREEELFSLLEKQERSYKENFEDKALEKFVRKPEETNLYATKMSFVDFTLLFLLLCVIFVFSVISSTKGWMEPYVAAPIAILSMIGIVILAKDTKKNDEENNKKYK